MIQFKQMLITPTIAKNILESNTSNRRVNTNRIDLYAKDMSNGRWKEDTAEVIKISKSNQVLDGQHRLYAIVKSNVAILMHVAFDLEDNVFDVLDTGKSRNSSDAFKVKNIPQECTIPSIISMYNLLVIGRRAGIQKIDALTNSMVLSKYYENEIYWQSVGRKSHSWYLAFAKILVPSFIGGFYSFFSTLDKEKAELFMSQLCTGIGIEKDCISQLRNKLMQDKMSPRKMNKTLKMALIIKTWNLFILDKSVKFLKYDTVNEEFPKAIKP